MEKTLLVMEVPSISLQFELWIPDFLKIRELIPLIVKAASEMSDGLYASSGTEMLCAR